MIQSLMVNGLHLASQTQNLKTKSTYMKRWLVQKAENTLMESFIMHLAISLLMDLKKLTLKVSFGRKEKQKQVLTQIIMMML